MSSRVYATMLRSFTSRLGLGGVLGLGPAASRRVTAPSHRRSPLTVGGRRVTAGALALACALGSVTPSHAQPPSSITASTPEPQSASELFAKFSTLTGLEASFVEVKKLALLKMPLQSEGTLYYLKPGYLLREVNKPKPSRVLITPEKLELKDEQNARQIDLRSRPDVKLFVESFTKVLAGDEGALALGFNIQFAPRPQSPANPTEDVWKLTLTPKTSPLDKLVTKLVLSGKGYAVERIDVFETKGDSSETTLRVTKIGRTFTAAEKQALFGIGPTFPGQ